MPCILASHRPLSAHCLGIDHLPSRHLPFPRQVQKTPCSFQCFEPDGGSWFVSAILFPWQGRWRLDRHRSSSFGKHPWLRFYRGAVSCSKFVGKGGTFLYVATVLQPVSNHSSSPAPGNMRAGTRVLFISIGMFVPFLLSALLGHDH